MLLVQQRVGALKLLQALECSHSRRLHTRRRTVARNWPSRISLRHRESINGWMSRAAATA